MKMSQKIVITLYFLLLVAILLTFPKATFGAADNATINVTVGDISEITVDPSFLGWTVSPCDASVAKLLDIRNTGSLNVSQIYAYVSTLNNETSRPYGKDIASLYAATGVIVLRNETDSPMYFAGRLEWNWTEDISNKDLSNMGAGCTGVGGNCSWGFVRNTSYEYMWAVSNGTGGVCNESGTQLGLESDLDNGTAGSREPETGGIGTVQTVPDYGIFSITRSSHLLTNSCVAVSRDCQKIYIYKYDKRTTPNFNGCTLASYVQGDNLVPYDVHTLTLNAYVPCGIPAGDLATGHIYIVAT
jgi:hypothetical protein